MTFSTSIIGGLPRIEARFSALREEGRAGFIPFLTAGDPSLEVSNAMLAGLAHAGADLIEWGAPFTDPMADGIEIQQGSRRALAAGQSMIRTLEQIKSFRKLDQVTPIIIMGYYNPIWAYGPKRFVQDALSSGVDGLIVVDLPPEEDEELCLPSIDAGLGFIRLATPTTDNARLPAVLANTRGFVYYVSVSGVTGQRKADQAGIRTAIRRIRSTSHLPIAVGFGISTPEQAKAIAVEADAVVVGSAFVRVVREGLEAGKSDIEITANVHSLAQTLSKAVREARK